MSSRYRFPEIARALRNQLAAVGLIPHTAKAGKSKKKKEWAKNKESAKAKALRPQMKDLWKIKEFSGLEYRGISTVGDNYELSSQKWVAVLLRTQLKRPTLLARSIQSVLSQDLRNTPISTKIVLLFDVQIGTERVEEHLSEVILEPNKNSVEITLCAAQNATRSDLLNEGLRFAHCDYIFCLDDDDYVYPNHIVTLVCALENRDSVAAYTAADVVYVDSGGDGANEIAYGTIHYSLWWSYSKLCLHNTFPIQAVMFRRPPEEVSFQSDLHALEDWMFWLRFLRGARS